MSNPSAIASAQLNVARSIERDDPVGALAAYEQSIALGRSGAMSLILGMGLVGVARLRSRMHDPRQSLEALHDGLTHSIYLGYRPVVVEVLGQSAVILLRNGELEPGTVLGGSLLRGALPAFNVRAEAEIADIEAALLDAREALGDQEYQRLYDRGAAMTYDEVLAFALDAVRPQSTASAP
jgi:hypothetical protein